jgi:hypothetical protein
MQQQQSQETQQAQEQHDGTRNRALDAMQTGGNPFMGAPITQIGQLQLQQNHQMAQNTANAADVSMEDIQNFRANPPPRRFAGMSDYWVTTHARKQNPNEFDPAVKTTLHSTKAAEDALRRVELPPLRYDASGAPPTELISLAELVNGVQGLERPKLEYPALNWDKREDRDEVDYERRHGHDERKHGKEAVAAGLSVAAAALGLGAMKGGREEEREREERDRRRGRDSDEERRRRREKDEEPVDLSGRDHGERRRERDSDEERRRRREKGDEPVDLTSPDNGDRRRERDSDEEPWMPKFGEHTTGSGLLREKELEHSLREFKLEEHAKIAKEHITAMDGVVVEGPCTDSGYASIFKTNISRNNPPLPDEPQCTADDKSNVKMRDEDTEDAKTLYSAATTIDLPKSQQYISELCSDILSKLENHFDSTNWNTLETALPSLIKAFAIKIGHDSSAQINQDIMYFIHKQHR